MQSLGESPGQSALRIAGVGQDGLTAVQTQPVDFFARQIRFNTVGQPSDFPHLGPQGGRPGHNFLGGGPALGPAGNRLIVRSILQGEVGQLRRIGRPVGGGGGFHRGEVGA